MCCAQSMGLQRLGHDSATEQHCFRQEEDQLREVELAGAKATSTCNPATEAVSLEAHRDVRGEHS